jgi:hypothetical protein
MAVGDFNGDGKPDLVTSNSFARSLSVFLGNGDGTFGPQTNLPMPGRTESVIAADFNGDGKLDLAAPNFEPAPYTVSIFLGNGDGTFGPRNDFPTGDVPYIVVADDFNHDGKLDLAINGQFGGISLLLGNGDGTFGPMALLPTYGTQSSALISVDLNADGRPDLMSTVSSTANLLSILLNNGNATFNLLPSYTLSGAFRLSSGDFNADGKTDLAVARYVDAKISILLGNGDGTFSSTPEFDTGLGPEFVITGDFNGDGKPDLATANLDAGTISIFLNTSH